MNRAYAFPLRAGNADLVFISVHLQPDPGPGEPGAQELAAVFSWIDAQRGSEKDFVIVGDMNFQNCAEMASNIPDGYASLNGKCQATTTNPGSPRPYDHAFCDTASSAAEINTRRDLTVINLIEEMRLRWPAGSGAFAGQPYDRFPFEARYSDHHPILFAIRTGGRDDD